MKSSIISIVALAAFVSADYPVGGYSSESKAVYETKSTYAPETTSSVYGYPVKHESSSVYVAKPTTTSTYAAHETTSTCTEEYAHSTSSAVHYPVYSTSTVVESVTYTVSKCPATVTNCPYGSKTSGVVTKTYTYPVETTTAKGYPVTSSKPAVVTYATVSTAKPYVSTSVPAVYPTVSKPAGPVYSTVTISTCVPSYITKVVTVTPSAPAATYPAGGNTIVTKPYGTGVPSGYASASTGAPAKPTTTGYPVTGAASSTKVGGLLMAVGLVAALL